MKNICFCPTGHPKWEWQSWHGSQADCLSFSLPEDTENLCQKYPILPYLAQSDPTAQPWALSALWIQDIEQ